MSTLAIRYRMAGGCSPFEFFAYDHMSMDFI